MYAGEDKVMECLKDQQCRSIADIARATSLHIDSVRRIVENLHKGGYLTIDKSVKEQLHVSKEYTNYCKDRSFPEFTIFKKALEGASVAQLSPEEKAFGLLWAKQKGFVKIEQGKLTPMKPIKEVEQKIDMLCDAYKELESTHTLKKRVLLDELYRRKFIVKKSEKQLTVQATKKTYTAAPAFDISTPAQDAPIGKAHPISFLTQKIKSIFVELGFEEMEGDIIQSAFWNFDALFQPQDHPARDLADTFYIKDTASLPSAKLVKKVKEAHEKSWKYKWSEAEAKRKVLRTHTTALSARYLAALPDKKPRKYFSVGKVFRNEATDFKHLTEFYQVEGIVVCEQATFCDLLGILKEFYRKLGFERIRFRPSYFPYTEPSLEVEVYFEPKKEWLELGGAGIFRPEVSIPLCNRYPVLAWGLSLERPLLLLLDLDDIRTLYRNDLDFLRNARVPL